MAGAAMGMSWIISEIFLMASDRLGSGLIVSPGDLDAERQDARQITEKKIFVVK